MTEPKHKTLADAICAARDDIGSIAKSGVNSFHKYNFAKGEDVIRAAQKALSRHGLTVSTGWEWHPASTFNNVMGTYTVEIAGYGDAVSAQVPAASSDKGDKAAAKASTHGYKYALRDLFSIPFGEDPEADAETDKAADRAVALGHEVAKEVAEVLADCHDPGELRDLIHGPVFDLLTKVPSNDAEAKQPIWDVLNKAGKACGIPRAELREYVREAGSARRSV